MSSLSWMHLSRSRRYPHSFTCSAVWLAALSRERTGRNTLTHTHAHARPTAVQPSSIRVYFSFCRVVSWLISSYRIYSFDANGARRESKDHPHSSRRNASQNERIRRCQRPLVGFDGGTRDSFIYKIRTKHAHSTACILFGPVGAFFFRFGDREEMDMNIISWFIDVLGTLREDY